MELLGTSVNKDYPGRVFLLCAVDTLENLASEVAPTSSHFALFVAMDARSTPDVKVKNVAKSLYSKGLVSLSAWGPDCERVHDLFDAADAEIHPGESAYESFIFTTWHSRESLEKALWGFVHCGTTASDYEQTCKEWFIVVVENPEWAQEVRRKFPEINTVSVMLPEDRPLSGEERTLIEWLIANGVPEAKAFAPQLDNLRVAGRCSCGCPTVMLAVGDTQSPATEPPFILADFRGTAPDGQQVYVVLQARNGKLSELEIFSFGDTSASLPSIESLKSLE